MNTLNDKQKAFCREYVKDFNATQAAVRSGYSEKTANRIASRMLSKVDIQKYIEQLKQDLTKDTKVTVEWIAEQLTDIAIQSEKDSDRIKALELLGKYKAMFTEKQKVEHSGAMIQRIIKVNPSSGNDTRSKEK